MVNKIDQADPVILAELRHAFADSKHQVVFVSAHTGEGISELEGRIEMFLNTLDAHVKLLVPYTRGDIVSRLHEEGTVLTEEYEEQGTLIDVRLPRILAQQYSEFAVDTTGASF